jgi:hypothetical protein
MVAPLGLGLRSGAILARCPGEGKARFAVTLDVQHPILFRRDLSGQNLVFSPAQGLDPCWQLEVTVEPLPPRGVLAACLEPHGDDDNGTLVGDSV